MSSETPASEDSIRRVANRVEHGGHNVPLADLNRRFSVGIQNLFAVYRPVVDRWSLYDNGLHAPALLAYGDILTHTAVDRDAFANVVTKYRITL